MSAEIRPFTIAVPDQVLHDLRRRLHDTRWPDAELVSDWSQGIRLAYVREVCRYWADEYGWRSRERNLNQLARHFSLRASSDPEAAEVLAELHYVMPLVREVQRLLRGEE